MSELDIARQAQQPTTQFEVWKQRLTLDQINKLMNCISPCGDCPAYDHCCSYPEASSDCLTVFKEWGEQRI